MKPRVYIETTIPSYLVSRPSRDLVTAAHQQITNHWWSFRRSHFSLYVSQFVLDEVADGDPEAAANRMAAIEELPVLDIDEGVRSLARSLIRSRLIPRRKATDAAHISVAAVHGMDYLLTWNCEHLANARLVAGVRDQCNRLGFDCPVICTPEQLMEK